ncbi:IclR family transcriptional regulator [Citricoccus sp. GCM10030269]|uniref:IclR family transcriptional regulator n=1 Tax=Citricoccus sp. GCM10030269 TaxID=3273388 RepID=UPI003612AD36
MTAVRMDETAADDSGRDQGRQDRLGRPRDISTARSGPRRSVLGRLHRLLSAFDHDHDHLTLSELSRRTGLPLTTTHRMVSELLDLGMLDRDDEDRLCIGVDLWNFGLLAPKTHGLQRIALPFMQDLYSTTGFPIHLGIPDGHRITTVESLRPRGPGNERPRIGQRDPYHVVALGMAVLAFLNPGFQERYLAHLEARHATGADAAHAVRNALAQTRTNGYSVNNNRTYPRVGIGAPILDRFGQPLAAISIVVPEGTSNTPYGLLVRSTARSIQRTAMEQHVSLHPPH